MISINNINKIQYDDKNDSIVEVMEYMIINEGKEVYDPCNLQEEDLRELY